MKIPSLIPANFPWLSTKFSFLLVIPLLLGLVSVPTLSTVAALVTLHNPAAELALTGVVSTKTHGGSGDFSIDLPLTCTPGIECRSGGPSQIVFTFATPVTFTSASVTAGTGSVSTTSGSGTTIVTVNLTGVTNAQWITLTLFGVNNGTATADVVVQVGALLGDTNGDGVVDSVDRAQTLSRSGAPPDGTTFRSDVNANGFIDSGDVVIVQSNIGNALPTTSILSSGDSAVVTDGDTGPGANGVLDPGETVTVALGVQNIGGPCACTTENITGTLQATGGVTNPSGPQNYSDDTGSLCSGSPTVTAFRYFSFTVDPALPCGSTVTATLQMQDGATNYGTITYTFVTGILALSQNFDGVVAPALPAGWTASATGIGVPWVTSTTTPFSAPNEAFAPDPSNIGDSMLVSPAFAVPAGGATLTFKNSYNTEATFDGEVLEISINGGAFADIITAGGTFVTGGYTGPISTAFGSPIAGRQAWSGNSGGYITSTVTLPPAANGQMAQLKWRMATDDGVAATGVRIDDIATPPDCTGSAPSIGGAGESPGPVPWSRLYHLGPGGPFVGDILMPKNVLGTGQSFQPPFLRGGVECRWGTPFTPFGSPVVPNVYNYQLIVPFGSGTGPVELRPPSGRVKVIGDLVLGPPLWPPPTASVDPSDPTGRTVVVNVTGVVDRPLYRPFHRRGQWLHVTLRSVNPPIEVNIMMGILIGDANDDRRVNSGDSGLIRMHSGQPLTGPAWPPGGPGGSFRCDLNTDVLINTGDTTIARTLHNNTYLRDTH